jgi:hypothetical protein
MQGPTLGKSMAVFSLPAACIQQGGFPAKFETDFSVSCKKKKKKKKSPMFAIVHPRTTAIADSV